MIDPRFANAGNAAFVPGFGAQQVPAQYHHHRHHRHHKHKSRKDDSPLSRDESIHKVDHGHPHNFQQNEGAQFGGGYGVPYGAASFGAYPQQTQYGGAQFGYANQQQQGMTYMQAPFAGLPGQGAKHHRRHHRHHRHRGGEAANAEGSSDQAQAVPEQLIGQRSSSVLDNDASQQQQQRSPAPPAGDENGAVIHKRHRHHRHHHHQHHAEGAHAEEAHQSHHSHAHSERKHTSVGADGYGHLNGDLIFIERGEHSPHRQEPPSGYEYKGKIEVQGINKEQRSQSRGRGTFAPQGPSVAPPQPQGYGPCPPGWQQMALSAAPGGPCPPGASMYTGQMVGAGGMSHAGLGGMGGFGGGASGYPIGSVGPMGAAGSGGGLGNFAGNIPYPSQGQLVADYIVGAGGAASSGEAGFSSNYQGTTSGAHAEHFHEQESEQHTTSRPTIIEVWQKRGKSESRTHDESRTHEKSRSRSRSPTAPASLDLERFRKDLLGAIERIVQRENPSGGKVQKTEQHHAEVQRQVVVNPEKSAPAEVRVIVQPIQPVFYMPRQTTGGETAPQPGPAIHHQPQAATGAPNVVYVPRNVYVPVIKPVFVPRERVIIRPQVIHVARPVLVDRPVPVTQRPIIIDRERPVPVPVRAGQAAAKASGSNIVREEFVYRENVPVAYGGRCADFAGGASHGYASHQQHQQQQQQYGSGSIQEVSGAYQNIGQAVNVNVPNQFQQSRSSSHLEVQSGRGAGGSFQESYADIPRANSASAVNVGRLNQQVIQQTLEQSARAAGVPAHCPTQIEVLDTAVNPFWQKTDQSTLMRRYGRPAYEIVHKTDQVEEQMYNELRQRTSSAGIQRSSSSASYGSGAGLPNY